MNPFIDCSDDVRIFDSKKRWTRFFPSDNDFVYKRCCSLSPAQLFSLFAHMPSSSAQLLSPETAEYRRILDPTYSSPNHHHHSSAIAGCHDPDYQDFPAIAHAHRTKKSNNDETRFAWEIEAAALDDEEDDEEPIPKPRRPSFASSEMYSSSMPNSPRFPSTPSLIDDLGSDADHVEHPPSSDLVLRKTVSHCDREATSVAIRKHWLSVSLRVRTKVFRAKKKLRSNSHSLG